MKLTTMLGPRKAGGFGPGGQMSSKPSLYGGGQPTTGVLGGTKPGERACKRDGDEEMVSSEEDCDDTDEQVTRAVLASPQPAASQYSNRAFQQQQQRISPRQL